MKNSILIILFLFGFMLDGAYGQDSLALHYEITGEVQEYGSETFSDSLAYGNFVRDLLGQLRGEGFLMADIGSFDHEGDSVVRILLETGKKYFWVRLNRGNLEHRFLLRSGWDPRRFGNKPFNYNDVVRLFDQILSQAENEGYPFAQIRLDSLQQSGDRLEAGLNYESGPLITFDTLQVTGSSKTDPVFLARLLKVLPGENFAQRTVDQSVKRIQNIPYLKLEGQPELSFQNSQATLYLPLNDRKINSIDGIIGFLPNETEESKMLVTGQFDLSLYNVGGKGRNYQLHWQRLTQYTQNLNVSGVEPMVLGSGIDIGASFRLLKEDTTFVNRDFKLDFGYQLSPRVGISFFSQWQSGDLLSVSRQSEREELPDVLDYRFHNYGVDLTFNGLDDVFFPREGWQASGEIGLGNKKILPNTGIPEELYEGVDATTLQYYVSGWVQYFAMLGPRIGLRAGAFAGELYNQRLLRNDLYRLGGLKSIRGFNENFFFTNRYVYANFEPRYYFGGNSYFLVFWDGGRLENKLLEQSVDYPFSFGGGLSMETQSGVFKFIYGVGKSNQQQMGVNFSKIHFGYTGRF